jgi:serine/threonine protein kinase
MLRFGYSATCNYEITYVTPTPSPHVGPSILQTFARMHTVSLLGEGETGRVYSVRADGANMVFAVKFAEGTDQEPARRALEHEGRVYWRLGLKAQLHHVLPIFYGLYQHPRMTLLFLEKCGPPVKDFKALSFKERFVSFDFIVPCATTNAYGDREQIYHNLVLLHNAGYIHGDLGPYNVLHAPDNSGFRIVDLESVRKHKCRALGSVSSASLLMRATKSCKSLQAVRMTLGI